MELDKAIKERHSVRRFSSKKPDWRDIMKAIDSARLAPLAGNIPAIRYLIIDDKEKIYKLSKASQQDFVATADYIIVVCSDLTNLTRSYNKRAEKYAKQQAGASIQNLLLRLTELGLATCWVGAFSDSEVKSILKIPDHIEVEAFFPIGYEAIKSKQRLKPSLDRIIFFNNWGERRMTPLKNPDAV